MSALDAGHWFGPATMMFLLAAVLVSLALRGWSPLAQGHGRLVVCVGMLACAIGITTLAANEASAETRSERTTLVVAQQVRPVENAVDLQARQMAPLRDAIEPLTYPVWGAVTPQKSTAYNPGDDLTFGGISRLSRVKDPGGSGRDVYLHRVVKADAAPSDGVSTVTTRAERQYIYHTDSYFWPGLEYWFCFAVRTKSGEYPAANDGAFANNVHLVWQTHTQGKGDTQPPLALVHDIGHNRRYFRRSWNTKPENTWRYNGGTNPDYEGVSDTVIGTFPRPDIWYKYIVHYRSGWTTAHRPKLKVWEAIGDDTYKEVVNQVAVTDFNDYNSASGSYNRIGIYKWSRTHWDTATSTLAVYATEIYSKSNAGTTDYFNECVASLHFAAPQSDGGRGR